MPSDPLPLSPSGKALLERLGWFASEKGDALREGIIAIEQEARTLAHAEVIAEAIAAVEGIGTIVTKSWPTIQRADVLAALSRLGERE